MRHERNLFDWAQQGTFYLMGINEQVVFEPFPVEVSDDFNTIKVKTAVYKGLITSWEPAIGLFQQSQSCLHRHVGNDADP